MNKISEHDAQAALVKTLQMHVTTRPELALFFAIPNGGHRDKRTAAKLKAEGVLAGIPDTMLPVARGGYHGLFIELKVGDNKPSKAQTEKLSALKAQGYFVGCCWEWTQALEIILNYLDGELVR